MGIAVKRNDQMILNLWGIGPGASLQCRANLNFRPITWWKRVLAAIVPQGDLSSANPYNISLDGTSTSDRSNVSVRKTITDEGEVDSATVVVIDSTAQPTMPGALYAQLLLSRPGIGVFQVVLEGYVYLGHVPSYPGVLEGPLDGRGRRLVVALGDPAAGAEYATNVNPVGSRRIVRGFVGTLVAAAVAVNRKPVLNWDDQANFYSRATPGGVATTGQTVQFAGSVGIGPSDVNDTASLAGDTITFSLPDIIEEPLDNLSFVTLNLQGTDNWGAGFLLVEEWIGSG